MTHSNVTETINIPKGVDNGVNLRVSKKGNSGLGGPAGDLMINLKVKPHPYFKRDGSDIHTDLFISISDVSKYFPIVLKFSNIGCFGFRSKSQNFVWRH